VTVAFRFPEDSHPPIVYPAAVVASSSLPDEAAAFLAFCAGDRARELFDEAGFSRP
jgi:molybdate transport system substrate-binding protein